MPKLPRVTAKIYADNAAATDIAQFGSVISGAVVFTSDIAQIQALPAYETGWRAAVISDENYPTLVEFNGLQKTFSQQIAYLLQSGMPEYDPGTDYYKGDWCKGVNQSGANTIFESLTDNNVGNPLTDTTHWEERDFSSKSGSGLPIGFIGTCAFGIDETKGLARYLNGSTMMINANTQKFVDKLTQTAALYPSILCTEEQWQATVTLSAFGQCGQFVLDKDAATVRLPKIITPIQGLTDLANLAKLVEAGLPNIEGNLYTMLANNNTPDGAFTVTDHSIINLAGGNDAFPEQQNNYNFNASLSNPIYGKSDTVQPEAVQYPYFIQIATGVEEEASITNTFEINNPYALLQPIWSDKKLNNLSWLRSNGQSNSKASYPDAYDLILTEYNSGVDETETVGGVEITYRRSEDGLKVTTDKAAFDSILEAAGTAWYYVIDTANEVFYLPQSNGFMQFGGEGDFVEAGLPNITGNFTTDDVGQVANGAFYYAWGTSGDGGNGGAAVLGFDASRSSAVYGKSSTVQPNAVKGYLYFYVGETIQNANLVNIGRLQEQLIERTTPAQAAQAAMPGGKWVDLTLGASGTKYTAPADGYFSVRASATAVWGWVNISDVDNNGHGINPTNNNTGSVKGILPVKKGTTVVVSYGSVNNFSFQFIYAQGAQQ